MKNYWSFTKTRGVQVATKAKNINEAYEKIKKSGHELNKNWVCKLNVDTDLVRDRYVIID